MSVSELAHRRQQRLISLNQTATTRALKAWKSMDFQYLDASWVRLAPTIVGAVTTAQLASAVGSDRFTATLAKEQQFDASTSQIVPETLAGVDGQGRDVEGVLYGAVTTTKRAVGSGLGHSQSFEAGATYLAAIVKTVVADMARAADIASGTGRGFTHYIRVVSPGACARCAILAGKSSAEVAFKRHPACKCTACPASGDDVKVPPGLHASAEDYFHSLSEAEQDRVFTKAGASAIRDGSEIGRVVSARRGARGIGYSSHGGTKATGAPRGKFVKTTIGYRPDGTPVQVYTTTEGTTVRGEFGRVQQNMTAVRRQAGARYSSTNRVRLMPESILEIAGDDLGLRQAFLRDAGYLATQQTTGAAIIAEQRADRILVDRATLKFNNFTLG